MRPLDYQIKRALGVHTTLKFMLFAGLPNEEQAITRQIVAQVEQLIVALTGKLPK